MKYLIAVIVVVLLGGYAIFRYQTRDLNFNQAYVEALAARLLPGAKPPPGSKGVVAADKELFEAAVLAPTLKQPLKGSELRVIVARIKQPPTDAQNIQKWKAFLEERKDLKHLGDQPALVQGHPALRSLTQVNDEPKMLSYTTVFGNVVVQVEGPEASFNEAGMNQFLNNLEATASTAARTRIPSIPRPPQTPRLPVARPGPAAPASGAAPFPPPFERPATAPPFQTPTE